MTLVVSWIGKDTHGYTSAYIASDSRVSWGNLNFYDSCRKTFFSNEFPDIIGFCGDVLFPSMVIPSIIELIDKKILYDENDGPRTRFDKFKKKLIEEIKHYPKSEILNSFEILYICRDIIEKGYPDFYAYKFIWKKDKSYQVKALKLPVISGLIDVMGSGASDFNREYGGRIKGLNANTTRNVFHTFSVVLEKMTDKKSGGVAQLVGLYRKPEKSGFAFGILHKRNRYYNGMRISFSENIDVIEWRNRNFEICSGRIRKRKSYAKEQSIDTTI
ncbi:MAG: hypothetical protein MUP71_10600 [Candidatus Aminicenantes bacterium]|nr:hypothetical protein [Candidatus Aminicenantes bacterium]